MGIGVLAIDVSDAVAVEIGDQGHGAEAVALVSGRSVVFPLNLPEQRAVLAAVGLDPCLFRRGAAAFAVQCDDDVGVAVAVGVAQGQQSSAGRGIGCRIVVPIVIRVLQGNDQVRRAGNRGALQRSAGGGLADRGLCGDRARRLRSRTISIVSTAAGEQHHQEHEYHPLGEMRDLLFLGHPVPPINLAVLPAVAAQASG